MQSEGEANTFPVEMPSGLRAKVAQRQIDAPGFLFRYAKV
jgi:hypothetical protein